VCFDAESLFLTSVVLFWSEIQKPFNLTFVCCSRLSDGGDGLMWEYMGDCVVAAQFTRGTWLVHKGDVTYAYICLRLRYMCSKPRPHVRRSCVTHDLWRRLAMRNITCVTWREQGLLHLLCCTRMPHAHMWMRHDVTCMLCRPRSFLVVGFRPRIHPCVWFLLLLSEPGWISAGFQWMWSSPVGFQEGFRAIIHKRFSHTNTQMRQSHTNALATQKCLSHTQMSQLHTNASVTLGNEACLLQMLCCTYVT